MTLFQSFEHPYPISPKYKKRIAYFCMEFGIDQALKIYSGGLGYLAGSHMRSAYQLQQPVIGIGILWKYGYYDQVRKQDQSMDVLFMERHYNFLEDTGITLQIEVHNNTVNVKVYYLPPSRFNTAPIFLLSTDTPENDYLSQKISHHLYDSNTSAKMAQHILLGAGGMALLEALDYKADIHHFNEAHPLPGAFKLFEKYQDLEEVKKRLVFTTHTPVPAGNEILNMDHLYQMSYFGRLELNTVREITGTYGSELNLTLAMLRLSRRANAVSQMHGDVARDMWGGFSDICPIGAITNAQNARFWADQEMNEALRLGDVDAIRTRKKDFKQVLFNEVADQTGKILDPDALTIVWARRYAPYKRAQLFTMDLERFHRLLTDQDRPVQFIWAGKPYPFDHHAIEVFNSLVRFTNNYSNCAVLVGYEIGLSKMLKQGSDVWLNNPRIGKEASGTSGMTAAMNGSLNFSIPDGWVPEFGKHLHNAFVAEPADPNLSEWHQDEHDLHKMMDILEYDVIRMYYENPDDWMQMVVNSMSEIQPFFDSNRMADEYYEKLYR
ncbi:MAG TPA: alpha-glucan family phosphorylase [Saprospiraceae bacterium]|nr:alpha-glucan family phosphorylase [Lewinellaceae bacterium]HPQ99878.1 alpha-glucan family phosphorylase [Saprospiraceae bacterium]HRV84689.1 alpha-glucan family phosphorylase [Saprospiraceae bacterium]